MSNNKHTPGPWNWVGTKRHPNLPCYLDGVDGDRVGVSFDGFTESEANARLIAAAPDLLEALQALFADYKQLADSGDAGNWYLEDMDVGKQALAAIARATNEQPAQDGKGEG